MNEQLIKFSIKEISRLAEDFGLTNARMRIAIQMHRFYFPEGDTQIFVWTRHDNAVKPSLKTIDLPPQVNNVLKKYRYYVAEKTVKPIEENDRDIIQDRLYLRKQSPLYVLYFPLNNQLLEVIYAVNLGIDFVEGQAKKFESYLQNLLNCGIEVSPKTPQKPPSKRNHLAAVKQISKEGFVLGHIQQTLNRAEFKSLFLVQLGRITPTTRIKNQVKLF
jgi:hypothetical protein